MSNINKLDGILAVEDLTDAAAAVVEGGGAASGSLSLDAFRITPKFSVSRGGSVKFTSSTREGGLSRGIFLASLRNTSTGRRTSPQTVLVGLQKSTFWSNVRGGSYQIELADKRDGVLVVGSYFISST